MRVLLCVAMKEEVEFLLKEYKFSFDKKSQLLCSSIDGNNIFLLITGMGKINAAHKLSVVLAKNVFDLVLNIGFAGSSNLDYILGSLFQVSSVSEWDLPRNQVRNIELNVLNLDLPVGLCLTGDRICNVRNSITIRADVIDMECYALSYVCKEMGVRFSSIKIVSDHCKDTSLDDINKNSKYLSEKLDRFTIENVLSIIGESRI